MSVESIFNYRRIDDRIATGGQPTEMQLEAMRDSGYSTVINLAPHDAASGAIPDEAATLSALGIDYVHIPMRGTIPRRQIFSCSAMRWSSQRSRNCLSIVPLTTA